MRPKALKPLDPSDAKLAEILKLDPRHQQRGLTKLLNRHPAHARAWIALAELHHRERRREEARHAAQRALDVDPGVGGHFSAELQQSTGDLITAARQRTEAEAERLARDADMLESRAPDDPAMVAARELQRILSLAPAEHAARLDILTRRFPDHPEIWLALAEALMVSRRLERALQAADRAIALDPELENRMSPGLEQARALYNRDHNAGAIRRLRAPGYSASPRGEAVQVEQSEQAEQSEQSAVEDEGFGGRSAVPDAPSPERPPGAAPLPHTRPTPGQSQEARSDDDGVEQALTHALERQDSSHRLAELRRLYSRYPDHLAVLFQYAIHAALAGDVQNAQVAGERLRVRSPEHYRQLYELAEQYWGRGQE